jgi:tellurite resistance protein TehA-like permease
MKNRAYVSAFLPILAFSLIVSILLLAGARALRDRNIDDHILLAGNILLFAVTAISYFIHLRSIRTPNPHAFVRTVYGSLIVKMVACMVAALLYGYTTKSVNKNAIFGCFILYVVYTFLEVKILLKFLKKSPNNA